MKCYGLHTAVCGDGPVSGSVGLRRLKEGEPVGQGTDVGQSPSQTCEMHRGETSCRQLYFFVIMKYECVALCRVMAQVSCELVAPKESRPNEGIMFFNIELSPMASPTFEQGR